MPSLESKLAFVLNHRSQWRDKSDNNPVKGTLALIQNELTQELENVGKDKFPEIDKLVIGKFDSATYQSTLQFVKVLKSYYQLRGSNAQKDKETLVASLTDTPEKLAAYSGNIMRYQNEAVIEMVENSNSPVRILEWDGQLVQKIYPIYFDSHRPKNRFDFTANFYNPTKHFMGRYFDTFYFNISIIWTMSLLLYVALYFDLLKRGVQSIENRIKYRKRENKF